MIVQQVNATRTELLRFLSVFDVLNLPAFGHEIDEAVPRLAPLAREFVASVKVLKNHGAYVWKRETWTRLYAHLGMARFRRFLHVVLTNVRGYSCSDDWYVGMLGAALDANGADADRMARIIIGLAEHYLWHRTPIWHAHFLGGSQRGTVCLFATRRDWNLHPSTIAKLVKHPEVANQAAAELARGARDLDPHREMIFRKSTGVGNRDALLNWPEHSLPGGHERFQALRRAFGMPRLESNAQEAWHKALDNGYYFSRRARLSANPLAPMGPQILLFWRVSTRRSCPMLFFHDPVPVREVVPFFPWLQIRDVTKRNGDLTVLATAGICNPDVPPLPFGFMKSLSRLAPNLALVKTVAFRLPLTTLPTWADMFSQKAAQYHAERQPLFQQLASQIEAIQTRTQ